MIVYYIYIYVVVSIRIVNLYSSFYYRICTKTIYIIIYITLQVRNYIRNKARGGGGACRTTNETNWIQRRAWTLSSIHNVRDITRVRLYRYRGIKYDIMLYRVHSQQYIMRVRLGKCRVEREYFIIILLHFYIIIIITIPSSSLYDFRNNYFHNSISIIRMLHKSSCFHRHEREHDLKEIRNVPFFFLAVVRSFESHII